MNYFLRNIILWTWCLPQTLLGVLLYITLKLRKDIDNKHIYLLKLILK